MAEYAHPEVLVSTQWVAEHRNDPQLRIVEVDVDTSAYEQGHIPGAIAWNWQTELQDPVRRDLIGKAEFERLMSRSGIANDTTVVVYGDNNNWFACWAFWQLKYYGHQDVRVMNGGRKKWLEEKRELSTEVPAVPTTSYRAKDPDGSIRARREEIYAVLDGRRRAVLVDVRSPDEFTGKIIAPPGMTETAQRGGHIPGAANIPWALAVREDGTFKSAEELRELYASRGVRGDSEVIAYCRIGERSSHTWFVLKYLLGFADV
ncbi:MAG: sulfurtransferase, partial [Firmicutes bacterium]|nr:sulfurtransferase [Bacillota bacterium]